MKDSISERNSIAEWMSRHGPIPARIAARVTAQIGSGLAAGHPAAAVRGDVQPALIVCAEDGSTILAPGPGGTAFVAPEVAIRPADAASEVFSLAATLFTLITGRVESDLGRRHSEPALFEAVPGPLRGLLSRALDPNPAARPTMRELVIELDRVDRLLPPVPPNTPAFPCQARERSTPVPHPG